MLQFQTSWQNLRTDLMSGICFKIVQAEGPELLSANVDPKCVVHRRIHQSSVFTLVYAGKLPQYVEREKKKNLLESINICTVNATEKCTEMFYCNFCFLFVFMSCELYTSLSNRNTLSHICKLRFSNSEFFFKFF